MILNKANFKEEIEDYKGLSLVDFFAPWCGPCKLMAPIMGELTEEYKDKNVKIAKINIDENSNIAQKYNVMSIPTIILYKDGVKIDQIIGYTTKEDLKNMISKYSK